MKRILLVLTLLLSFSGSVFAKSYFDEYNYPKQVIVTGSAVNVRSGPSTGHMRVGMLYKNNIVDCHGKMNGWFLVHLSNDTVGMISGSYAKGYYASGSATQPPTATSTPKPTATPAPTAPPAQTGLTADEQEMFNLVNAERRKNGLTEYKINLDLTKIARLKSQDMVNKNYFSHTSPTYGSPFDMMRQFGISYRAAGENLAANRTVQAAHTSLMNSSGHRANILNSTYTDIGIGIVASPTYGKMFTQMFIAK